MKFIKIPGQIYEMMDTVVTQQEWIDIMGNNPSFFKPSERQEHQNKFNDKMASLLGLDHDVKQIDLPVEQVSWEDAQLFIKKLNNKKDGYKYRLPKEKEWEFCAKPYDSQNLKKIAWYNENSQNKTHRVKQKVPNEYGLYDMLGNVWEWCEDLYDKSGSARVVRGGSWFSSAQYLRSGYRGSYSPGYRGYNIGFRLIRERV